jgi:hypothetical protein
MNNGEKHLVKRAQRVGLSITKNLQTGNYSLTWRNGIICAENIGIFDADGIIESCAAALKRKEQRFRNRAAALGLRFMKKTDRATGKPFYFLKATETTYYGAETLERLAAAFFHLPEA